MKSYSIKTIARSHGFRKVRTLKKTRSRAWKTIWKMVKNKCALPKGQKLLDYHTSLFFPLGEDRSQFFVAG
jgi:hypothetical protein